MAELISFVRSKSDPLGVGTKPWRKATQKVEKGSQSPSKTTQISIPDIYVSNELFYDLLKRTIGFPCDVALI